MAQSVSVCACVCVLCQPCNGLLDVLVINLGLSQLWSKVCLLFYSIILKLQPVIPKTCIYLLFFFTCCDKNRPMLVIGDD